MQRAIIVNCQFIANQIQVYNKVVHFYFQLSSVLADTTHGLITVLTVSNYNQHFLAIHARFSKCLFITKELFKIRTFPIRHFC